MSGRDFTDAGIRTQCVIAWEQLKARIGLPAHAWSDSEQTAFQLGYVAGLQVGLQEAREALDAQINK